MTAVSSDRGDTHKLTARELDVLVLLGHHLTNKEIALRLQLSLFTVKDYVESIRQKLDAVTRGQAVDKARSLGLLPSVSAVRPSKPNNLPVVPTPIIGRSRELREIMDLLSSPETRLVTVTGPGGIGKTRIMIAAAGLVSENGKYPDGTVYISAITLESKAQLLSSIAEALGLHVSDKEQITELVMNYLASRRVLLMLDSYEHLVSEVSLISQIISSTQTTLLITSRERLHIYGEQVYTISGLNYADAHSEHDAHEMFVACANRLRATLEFAPEERSAITQICKLVEGFPLAIELASSWAHILPIKTIADKIEGSLDILESDTVNIPQRHRSIRAVFDYSLQFLSPELGRIFLSMAYCRGTFSLEAASAISGASISDIRDLVDKSLIYVTDYRYRYHELIRQFASELLSKNADLDSQIRTTYMHYYADLLLEHAQDLYTSDEFDALIALKLEIANIRHALQIAMALKNKDVIGQSMRPLLAFYELTSRYEEGRALFEQIEAAVQPSGDAVLLAIVQVAVSAMSLHTQAFNETKERLVRCERVLYPAYPDWLGIGYRLLGELETNQGNFNDAVAYFQESIEIYEEFNSPVHIALAERRLGKAFQDIGHTEQAYDYYIKSQKRFVELHYDRGIAMVLHRLGDLAYDYGRYEEAQTYLLHSLSIHRTLYDTDAIGRIYNKLGILSHSRGDMDKASEYFHLCYEIAEQIGVRYQLIVYANNIGVIEQDRQNYPDALAWFEKCLLLANTIGDDLNTGLALNNLGRLAYLQQRYAEALEFCLRSLEIRRKTAYLPGLLYCLYYIGDILVATGDSDDALAHYIEGLKLAMSSQSVVRGLDLLLGVARAVKSPNPCLANNIATLIETHPATQAKSRVEAKNLVGSLTLAELACEEDIHEWQQLATAVIERYSKPDA